MLDFFIQLLDLLLEQLSSYKTFFKTPFVLLCHPLIFLSIDVGLP